MSSFEISYSWPPNTTLAQIIDSLVIDGRTPADIRSGGFVTFSCKVQMPDPADGDDD